MAECIPNTLETLNFDVTHGEKKVFNALKHLPNECIVWYEVVLHEKNFKPDFMVLNPSRGLYIIEVKDWSVDAIQQATPDEFVIKWRTNLPVVRMNPELKCQIYLANARELLTVCPELRDERYNLLVPINYFVAFPNISKKEFDEIGLGEVLDQTHILFQENIANETKLFAELNSRMPTIEPKLNVTQIKRIRQKLRKDVTVEVAPQDVNDSNGLIKSPSKLLVTRGAIEREFAIDLEQEKVAKNLGEGPRLLRGLAGSGKTLILLMRAKLAVSNAEHLGQQQRILVLCWNISLANYMRQAFNNINIPFHGEVSATITGIQNSTTVEVMHFMAWVRAIYEQHGKKGYGKFRQLDTADQTTAQLSNLTLPENAKYDAIYLDEAQDFREEWIEFLFAKALKGSDPKNKNFIVSADDAQRIYRHQGSASFSWANLQIPMQGRSKVFRRVYRNSARVWMFAGFLLGNIGEYYCEDDGKPSAEIWFAPKSGHDPEFVECKNLKAQVRETVKAITDITSRGYSPRNILVLYRSQLVKGYQLVKDLRNQLNQAGIKSDWITENANTKHSFKWLEDSVKISTVHSAKGLDAPVVIILGAESFNSTDKATDEMKLMYVALTRAREYLKIFYTGEGGMIDELKRAERMYNKYKGRVLELEEQSAQLPAL